MKIRDLKNFLKNLPDNGDIVISKPFVIKEDQSVWGIVDTPVVGIAFDPSDNDLRFTLSYSDSKGLFDIEKIKQIDLGAQPDIDAEKKLKAEKKIELAPQFRIDELHKYVVRVLKAMGHEEALVTDESKISDFKPFFWEEKKDNQKWLTSLKKKLKIEVKMTDYVVDVAEKLKANKKEKRNVKRSKNIRKGD